jgi:hypothetical protein
MQDSAKEVWRGMLRRCENPKHKHWKHYGGSGIKVWANFLYTFGYWQGGYRATKAWAK